MAIKQPPRISETAAQGEPQPEMKKHLLSSRMLLTPHQSTGIDHWGGGNDRFTCLSSFLAGAWPEDKVGLGLPTNPLVEEPLERGGYYGDSMTQAWAPSDGPATKTASADFVPD